MRKFKLIKEYPGSPKLETIVEVKHDGYIYWNVNSNENNPTNYIHNSSMEQYLEFWEEVIEKDYGIFTTEDGIDIFKGDKHWFLCDGLDEIFEGDWKSEFHKEYVEKCKCFSTKEKAEEYILLNKLCLSLNDVNEVFNNRTPKNKILYELKELVNTKING